MGAGAGTTILRELQLLRGDLFAALETGDGAGLANAERCYRLAFERAETLKIGMTRPRAATRLTGLLQSTGDPEAAARTLGPVFAAFTEGSATADLREARDLLVVVAPTGSPQ